MNTVCIFFLKCWIDSVEWVKSYFIVGWSRSKYRFWVETVETYQRGVGHSINFKPRPGLRDVFTRWFFCLFSSFFSEFSFFLLVENVETTELYPILVRKFKKKLKCRSRRSKKSNHQILVEKAETYLNWVDKGRTIFV